MKIINGLVCGPFKNEQEFKRAVLDAWVEGIPKGAFFEVENEEKEPGMPDTLAVFPSAPAFLTEFKYSDKNGIIEFRKSQPLFYKRYCGVPIQILAWDCRGEGRVVHLEPSEVVDAKALRIKLPQDIRASTDYNPEDDE